MTQIAENTYIRPEHIEISQNGIFNATIKNIVFYGSFYEIIISCKNQELLVHSFDDSLEVGEKVKYNFNGGIFKF
jgi:ABC-type sugar transport system ATPase subunit